MKKIGYAVLGLGIGLAHADAVLTHPDATLVALCDVDSQKLEKAKTTYPNARLYDNFEALVADPDVDVISICLPSHLHADYAVRAMRAGKHVLVETAPMDLPAVATAMGVPFVRSGDAESLPAMLEEARTQKGVCFIEVLTES